MPPWERQPNESARAYSAFCTYRNLGPKRSVLRAWRLRTGCEKAAVPGNWNYWRAEHDWKKRAETYDAEMERHHRALTEEIETKLEALRSERKLFAQSAYPPLIGQLIDQLKAAIPSMSLTDRTLIRDDGTTDFVRGTSPAHLARFLRELREIEAALHHGFPKSGLAVW